MWLLHSCSLQMFYDSEKFGGPLWCSHFEALNALQHLADIRARANAQFVQANTYVDRHDIRTVLPLDAPSQCRERLLQPEA